MLNHPAPVLHATDQSLEDCSEFHGCTALTARRSTEQLPLLHFLYRMVQDLPLAEEMAIEALSQLNRGSSETSQIRHAMTRLFRLATELAINDSRCSRQTRSIETTRGDVCRAVAAIPAKQRAAMIMHKYHRMDSWQIANVLDCSESVARSLLSAAYARLRMELAPQVAQQITPRQNYAAG